MDWMENTALDSKNAVFLIEKKNKSRNVWLSVALSVALFFIEKKGFRKRFAKRNTAIAAVVVVIIISNWS